MRRSKWHLGKDWWRGVAIAAIGFAVFFVWLAAFETYVEPWARRSYGALVGRTIRWTPAGPLRIWGSREPAARGREGSIAVAGLVVVLLAAAVPVLVLYFAVVVIGLGHEALSASAYLVSVPLMSLFVVRVMRREPD